MAGRSPLIGIDLGTTNSVAAYFRDGAVTFIENGLGHKLTPSVVALDPKTQTFLVGRAAKDMLAASPHLAAATFKRSMGADSKLRLGQQVARPGRAVRLRARLAAHRRRGGARLSGHPLRRDRAGLLQRRAAIRHQASRRGGRLRCRADPQRADRGGDRLRARSAQRRGDLSGLDLGGGTFDVCVMELFEGMLAVKSVAGDSRLGGEDFTELLLELVAGRVGIDHARARAEDLGAWALLYKRCELLKRQLSSWEEAEIAVPPVRGQLDVAATVRIRAGEAEGAYAPLIDRLIGPCRSAMKGADLVPKDLAEVILVGGATRMPCVRRFVSETFGRAPLMDVDPDLVVAQGAAIQAALCDDDAGVADIVVTDVASHSMGVETGRQIATRIMSGFFTPVIHRNTVIPTSQTEVFSPIEKGQTQVHLVVYEGESRRVEENTRIGELLVKNLPPDPERAQIEVTFTYDLDGILEVEARVRATGESISEVFHRKGGRPTGADFERAMARIRQIKADPGQRPRYRDLMARADLLWKEATGDRRHVLGHGIEQFESALASRAPQAIEDAYRSLLSLCERIDGGERW